MIERGGLNLAAYVENIFDQIGMMLKADKVLHLDGVDWRRRPRAGGFDGLEYVAPVSIDGVIRDGLAARISCRSDLIECEVHAQLQVFVPAIAAYIHIQRVDWRPNSRHTNDGKAPAALRFRTFTDRWHEFNINRRLGLPAFRQMVPGIAQELPCTPACFNELLAFLGEVWNVSGVIQIPQPPWEGRII